MAIDQFYKSHNAPAPYPTMHHSEQKCTHFCSEWCIVGYGTGALWDLCNRSTTIPQWSRPDNGLMLIGLQSLTKVMMINVYEAIELNEINEFTFL